MEVSTKFSTFATKFKTNMGSKEKLVERFKKKPKDFTYEETIALLAHFGYGVHNKGATSGSRVRFKNETTGVYIDIHRPHPGSIMKEWMISIKVIKVVLSIARKTTACLAKFRE